MTRSSPGRRRPAAWRSGRRTGLTSPRARRALAAALAAIAVALLVQAALGRPDPADVAVVVPARDLPVGTTLSTGDVELRHLPPGAVPAGVLTSVTEVVGGRTAVPLVSGRAVVLSDLRASALLDGLPEGSVAAYLPLDEPAVAALLIPGDRIDVHSPVDGSVVVPAALVLRVEDRERPGLWVALGRPEAVTLSAARGADPLGASLQVSLRPTPTGG